MTQGIVLCVEDSKSQFAASQQIYESGRYVLVTATAKHSALAALKAFPNIEAAVLDCPSLRVGQHVEVASAMETIRPGIPKFLVTDYVPAPARAPQDLCSKLHLHYVERLQALVAELNELMCVREVESAKTRRLLEQAKQLRGDSKRLRAENRALIRAAIQKAIHDTR